jgi:phosphoribosyl-ATP pyrophosphohydrolase/phosphoribosyl-AMP cyclohydrolase
MLDLSTLDFTKGGGLVTVIAQDATTGAVLMLAHADREALERTIETGEMHYRSRSRGLWRKGDTSGNVQRVVSLSADCDGDAVLARVVPAGPACHVGTRSCFGAEALAPDALARLDATIASRSAAPADAQGEPPAPSYTRRLLADRNLRLKKIGEEAGELIVALADGDRSRAVEEGADLIFHTLVGLRDLGVSLDDVREVLARRAQRSSTGEGPESG